MTDQNKFEDSKFIAEAAKAGIVCTMPQAVAFGHVIENAACESAASEWEMALVDAAHSADIPTDDLSPAELLNNVIQWWRELDAIPTTTPAVPALALTDEQIEAKLAKAYYPPKDPGNELLQRVFPGDLVKVVRELLCLAAPEATARKPLTDDVQFLRNVVNDAAPMLRTAGRPRTADLLEVATRALEATEREPLTDEQVFNFWKDHGGHGFPGMLRAYRAIERAK